MTTFTTSTTNLLDLIQHESGCTFRKETAKEYSGACPFCRDGNDRFRVWPGEGRYWCRVCGRKGDAIQFLREYKHLPFAQAKDAAAGVMAATPAHTDQVDRPSVKADPITAPSPTWLEQGRAFAKECKYKLLGFDGSRALSWLEGRGLQREIVNGSGIGLNPEDRYVDRETWGLEPATREDGSPKGLWLPKGITIPWFFEGELWGVRIRRPTGEPKYYWLPGGTMGLYGATLIKAGRPVVLVEGEIDALTIRQAGILAVATGSTNGARHLRWVARLASASRVLVAYDADDAGETAASYWLDALPNARRWRPFWGDANAMVQAGADIAAWVKAGLQ